jgi:predicted dithiol-disulfide oxidoreductase (DUF899 family)
MSAPAIAGRDEWLVARRALLARERELTRMRDAVAAERRALPWVRIDTPYVFAGPNGPVTLAELFGRRSQLAVYHFMLTPDSAHICPGCSFLSDHVDAARQHFEHADLSFAAISRAPLDWIERVRARMGWHFNWVSSHGTSFNADFGVHFTPEQLATGTTGYNYGTSPVREARDMHGTSIFARDASGQVFHTYSAYARGSEMLVGAFNWLDLVPKGRNEGAGTQNWLRLHDEYTDDPSPATCCSG